MKRYDIVIIGAGMAGASLAAELAVHASVALLEAEAMPGYHATGRSGACWVESGGGPGVQPLTSASEAFLDTPPSDVSERGFLTRRGALHLAAEPDFARLDAFAACCAESGLILQPLKPTQIEAWLPGLRPGPWRGLFEASAADIDVSALHAAYLRMAKRRGTDLYCSAPLRAAFREAGRWCIDAGEDVGIEADILVNAAGAWADDVARIAEACPLGIQSYRRTIVQLRVDPSVSESLPLVTDVAERFSFKPDAGGRLWVSPHDDAPMMPGDAMPDEDDVATAIDRVEAVMNWRVERIERNWAGLCSSAPDRLPIYGLAQDVPGFFWFAGQGSFGIQTAPAAARLGASLLTGGAVAIPAGIDPVRYGPKRFTKA